MAGIARTGLLGGVFDPPHVGHVALGRAAVDGLELERLVVLVVAEPGHKGTVAPPKIRLELARLAFEDLPGLEVKLDSHTRTVDYLEVERPENAVFILGADEFADFTRWKEPERVLELVRLAVAMRPGVPEVELREVRARLPAPDRISFFEMEPMLVSSTEIRERVAAGQPIDGLVPPKVADAIERLGLYRED